MLVATVLVVNCLTPEVAVLVSSCCVAEECEIVSYYRKCLKC